MTLDCPYLEPGSNPPVRSMSWKTALNLPIRLSTDLAAIVFGQPHLRLPGIPRKLQCGVCNNVLPLLSLNIWNFRRSPGNALDNVLLGDSLSRKTHTSFFKVSFCLEYVVDSNKLSKCVILFINGLHTVIPTDSRLCWWGGRGDRVPHVWQNEKHDRLYFALLTLTPKCGTRREAQTLDPESKYNMTYN